MRFEGIAAADLDRRGFTPYEFETEDGVPVRLHDMSFLGFDHQAHPPTLTLRFVYDDPHWTPPEARATPVAVFRFDDVHVRQWEDEQQPVDETRGQVTNLGFHGPSRLFSLETGATTLTFSAERLAVHLESAAGS